MPFDSSDFFFSSRRRHTRYIGDWSSDVCSSDLMCDACEGALPGGQSFVSVIDAIQGDGFNPLWLEAQITFDTIAPQRSEERRVGKGVDVGGGVINVKKMQRTEQRHGQQPSRRGD